METIEDCLKIRKVLRKTLGLATNDREDRFFCRGPTRAQQDDIIRKLQYFVQRVANVDDWYVHCYL